MTHPQQSLAVTMGEPAGIGLETLVAAWQARATMTDALPFFCLGPLSALNENFPEIPFQAIKNPLEASDVFARALPVYDIPLAAPVTPGTPNPLHTTAVLMAIEKAVEMAAEGHISGFVTLPIHKGALYDAGFEFKGHTDYLAALAGRNAEDAIMMMVGPELRVIPLTHHVALKDAIGHVTKRTIVKTAEIIIGDLKSRFGITQPRLAISGVNPHAGEDGAMGREELDHIIPAIEALWAAGHTVTGPHPADSLFSAAERPKYDAVLAMYHDQALIPVKTLDFEAGVNVTLGLPFIRTSPDHGTALNIAGTGQASPKSLMAALMLASQLAGSQK